MPRPKKSDQPVRLYVPDYFDPAVHLGPEFRHREQEAWYILHLIIMRRVHLWNRRTEYVGLLAVLLVQVVKGYARLLEDLRVHGAVEWKDGGFFLVGRQARKYRLARELHGHYHAREVTDPLLARRIRAFRAKDNSQMKAPIHKYLERWVRKIEVDKDAAFDYIDARAARAVNDLTSHYVLVETIHNHEPNCTPDDFGRRFHSPVAQCPKYLRKHLHYKGERLVNLDIANSQPFFLGLLLLNVWQGWNRQHGNGMSGEVTPFSSFHLPRKRKLGARFAAPSNPLEQVTGPHSLSSSSSSTLIHPHSPPPHSDCSEEGGEKGRDSQRTCDDSNAFDLGGNSEIPGDVRRFTKLCSEGILYETLADQSGQTRERVKKLLFKQILFCKINKKRERTKLGRFMNLEYPQVMQGIRAMKRGRAKNQYKIAAMLLQRLESWIMLGCIATTLMRDHPEVPIWTIHDSIMTTETNAPLVQGVMREVFAAIGIQPSIRPEHC